MNRFVAVVCALMGVVWTGCGSTPPSSLEFVEVTPAQPKIGEIATLRFRAIDSRGEPMSGAPMNFRIQGDTPGVTISPAIGSTNKGTGIAEVQILASARVSSVVVVAESEGISAVSPPITFAGALPSARQFTFQCGELGGEGTGGIHALIAYDNSRNLVAGIALKCTAHVGDRNGDGVTDAQVSFITEAGTIGPTEISKTNLIGNASILYKTSLPLPREVKAETFSWNPPGTTTNPSSIHTGDYFAPLWMHPFDWVTNPILGTGTPGAEPRRNDPLFELLSGRTRENNPRDNLVAMVAVTTGEEAFDDVNNNGAYDNTEPFTDTTEPFVDYNDNGTWDPDERYIDTNVNGKWDGKNALFDASTLIWVQEKILWTGLPSFPHDITGSAPTFRQISPTGSANIPHFGCVTFTAIVSDPWFNPIARSSNSDGCILDSPDTVKANPEAFSTGVLLTYPAGTTISAQVCDAHDPNSLQGTPPTPIPPFPSPVGFTSIGRCTHTFSELSPAKAEIAFPAVTGTVL